MTSKQLLIGQMEFYNQIALQFSDGFSDAQAMVPYAPGGNHLIWLLGHMGYTRTSIQALCTGEDAKDDSWRLLFENGSEPVADPSVYPSLSELRSGLESRFGAFMDFLQSWNDEDVEKPVSKDVPGAPFLKTYKDALNMAIADHLMHLGQILVLRKIVGLPSPFGAMSKES